MRTPLLLAAAVASVAIAAGPAQAKSRHTTTRFAITIPNSAVLTNPPNLFASPTEPPPGAYTISGVGAANGPGKLDGKLLFTLVSASPTEEVTTAILSLKKGLITFTGVGTEAVDVEHFAITGGTGRYTGIRGEATLSGEQDSDDPSGATTFTLTLRY